jgi:hypothetical protein
MESKLKLKSVTLKETKDAKIVISYQDIYAYKTYIPSLYVTQSVVMVFWLVLNSVTTRTKLAVRIVNHLSDLPVLAL